MRDAPRRLAVLFRYGAGEHIDFLPALPDMVNLLRERGVEVHHFGFKGGVPLPESLTGKLILHEGPLRVRRRSEWDKRLKAVLWLAGLPLLGWRLQRQGFDRVFVDETLPLSAALLRLGYRGRLMFTVHDFFMEIYWERSRWLRIPGRLVQKLDLQAWRKLDRIFTRVEAAKNHLADKGVDADRIAVVPDPVDLEQFAPLQSSAKRQQLRDEWGVSDQDVLAVHHGIMHPNKGNLRLVKAWSTLRAQMPELKLLLIGDGPEMPSLLEAVTAEGLEGQVILTGWLPGLQEISEALQAADIGLVMRKGLPGDHFHVTSTLVHNLACGLPVLAARLDGVSEVLADSGAGELFDPDGGKEFQDKILQLSRDPVKRAEMGRKARVLAEKRFDPQVIALEYVEQMLSP